MGILDLFFGQNNKKQSASTQTSGSTTYTPQWWGQQTSEYLTPLLQNLMGYAQNQYQNAPGMSPQQQSAWSQTVNAMNQYGAAGPYGQVANQYLQPYMGQGWMNYLQPEIQAQRTSLAEVAPLQEEQFWNSMKNQLGPMWGTSGKGANAVADAYGNLKMNQAQQQIGLEQSIQGAKERGMGYTAQVAPTYAQMIDPTQWGARQQTMLSYPEEYKRQQQQQAFQQLMPFLQELMKWSGLAFQTPQQVITQGTSDTEGKGSETKWGAELDFFNLFPTTKK